MKRFPTVVSKPISRSAHTKSRNEDSSAGTPAFSGEPPSDDPRFEIIERRDRRWDGRFVFGVTSTGIYCRPTCPARRPRRDRVRFFPSGASAEEAGFRACRRCRPEVGGSDVRRRSLVARAVALLDGEGYRSSGFAGIARELGVSRSHLQRVFRDVVGVPPHEYLTRRKAAHFQAALAAGNTVGRAAYDAGFNSLSRAQAALEAHVGMTPGAVRRGGSGVNVRYAVVPCSLGMVLVALTERGVCRVMLGDDAAELEELFHGEYPNALPGEIDGAMREAVEATVAIAAGQVEARVNDIPLDLHGTAFQLRVWRALQRVPRGATTTYTDLAEAAGNARAVRAAGTACGANPVALLVPCHRALRRDGSLGGYRWGLERKVKLLEAERVSGKNKGA